MHFIRLSTIAALVLTLTSIVSGAEDPGKTIPPPPAILIDHVALKKLSWQLLCQASTFRELTVLEMIDVLHTNGFHHLELIPGQPLSSKHKDIKVGPEIGAANLEMLNARLKEARVDVVSYSVPEFGRSEVDTRKIFEFARGLKVKNVVGAPSGDSLEMLDKLATEYQINVAILNQPGLPPPYATGDALLQAVQERSTRIGVCADIAEWHRAGQDPVDCVRKLKGRIFEVYLKDSSSQAETAVVADVLKELAQEKFKGAFCVQTATGSGPDLIKNLATVVNSFSDVVTNLAATTQ